MKSGYSDGERETKGIGCPAGLPVMSSGYSDSERETWGIGCHAAAAVAVYVFFTARARGAVRWLLWKWFDAEQNAVKSISTCDM